MICIHCRQALGADIGEGLFVHARGLQRCQSADVPYGHMGHPSMPCPDGGFNPCSGSREDACLHTPGPAVGKVKDIENVDGGHLYWCPGCDEAHQFLANPGPWGYDGNTESPTLDGSVLVRGPQRSMPGSGSEAICHSFIAAGMVQFLSDSTHALSGQTVPMGDWP